MLALYRTLSQSYFRQRWSRTVLIVLTIALGVATLVATRGLHQSLKSSALNSMNPLSGVADVLLTNGSTGVPVSLANDLKEAKIPGVKDFQPIIISRATIPELDNQTVWILGVELELDRVKDLQMTDNPWGGKLELAVDLNDLTSGPRILAALYVEPHLSVVTPALAELIHQKNADPTKSIDEFRLRLAGEERRFGRFGTMELKGEAAAMGDYVVFLPNSIAATLVYPNRPDYRTQINVQLEEGVDAEQVKEKLQALAGNKAIAQTVEAYDMQLLDVTAGLELGFLLGSIGALIVGVFLVYNAMSVSVAERRHDIGILRSVGATRYQIALLFVGEAFILGLIGSLIGLPLGLFLAKVALGPLNRLVSEVFIPVGSQGIDVSFASMLVALGAGVGTAVFAAFLPALQAAQEEPANAVRRVPVTVLVIYRILHIGLVVVLISTGLGFVFFRDYLPLRSGAFGGIAFFLLGVLVAMPLLTAVIGRAIQPFFRTVLGLPGRLAADNLVLSPGRTGLVVAAIAATTALVIQTAGFIHSSKIALLGWVEEKIAADLYVTSGDNLSRLGQALPMPQSLRQDILALDGVEAALPVRFHRIDFRNRMVFLLAVDPNAFDVTDSAYALGQNFRKYPRLVEPGTCLVSENFIALYKINVGDKFTILGRNQPIELEVLGSVVDYTWNRGTVLIHEQWYREEFADERTDVFDVYLKEGTDPEEVRTAMLAKWKDEHGLHVETRAEFSQALSLQLDRVYGISYAQEIVLGLVALMGVMSALFISILQRRRELGLLRAVGASRSQVLRTVLAEAGLMGFLGASLGLIVGIGLQWYILRILIVDEAGFLFPMSIPWFETALVFGLSILLPVLVGIGPALQATEMRIADAIAYE